MFGVELADDAETVPGDEQHRDWWRPRSGSLDSQGRTSCGLLDEENPVPLPRCPDPTLVSEDASEAPALLEGVPPPHLGGPSQDQCAETDEVKPTEQTKTVSPAPEFDLDEEEDEYGIDGFRPSSYGPMGSSSMRLGSGRADTLLDFIDEVSEGISSYLGFLEERHKGVVYDRHEKAESVRWKDLLRKIHSSANKASAAPKVQEMNEDDEYAQRPVEDWSAELRPCRPPKDVPFEDPPPIPGETGRRRLAFSACFESGNLAMAKSDSATSYTLFLDFDVNTSGYTQWFYYGVRGGHQGQRVTFRIANMSKAESLFCTDRGMRPVVWSEKAARGWERGCSDVSYYPNEHRRNLASTGEHSSVYYTLEFTYTFEFDEDTVFFAYHYPYTYTHLQDFIGWLIAHPYISRFLCRKTLCRTIGGLACDILEIGEDEPSKPLAVVTARVHPGESNSSWMAQGLLQFLCSPASEAQALRDACTWLVVPMLNPDGVVQGSYRCGLAGADLNRAFQNPHRKLHPTVWHLKERLRGRRIDVYLDLHGHSKREGIFLYGGTYGGEDERSAQVKLLPKLCSIASSDFKFYQCVFSVQESKLTAARLVAFLQFGILHAYTVEASFSSGGPVREEETSNAGQPPPMPTGGFASHTAARAALERNQVQSRPTNILRRSNSIESLPPSDASEDEGFTRDYCRKWSNEHEYLERQSFSSATCAENASDIIVPMVTTVPSQKAQVEIADETTTPVVTKANFDPSRLELAGPTLLKSLFSCWQLTKGLRGGCDVEGEPDYSKWRHLHYERLTVQNAKDEFQKLLQKKGDSNDKYAQAAAKLGFAGGNDSGSDSQPSEDEKSAAELSAIHRRILAKLRRRGEPEAEKPKKEEEPMYKTVIAFGKTLRLPIVKGRLAVPDIAKGPAGAGAGAGGLSRAPPTTDMEPSGARPRSAPSGPARAQLNAAVAELAKRNNMGAAEGQAPETNRSARRGDGFAGTTHRASSYDRESMRQNGVSSLGRDANERPRLRQADIGKFDPSLAQDHLDARDHVDAFLAKMYSRQHASVLLDKKEGSVYRHRSDDGCYGPSDVRSFVEVRSIKPQNSASRRAAAQLRKPLTGPTNTWRDWAQQRQSAVPGTTAVAFSLPPASAMHPGQKRSPGQALHRVPIEKPPASATSSSATPVPAVSGSAAPVVSSDGRHTPGGGRPCSPDRPGSPPSSRRKANNTPVPTRPSTAMGNSAGDQRVARTGRAASGGSGSDRDLRDLLDVGMQESRRRKSGSLAFEAPRPPEAFAGPAISDEAVQAATSRDAGSSRTPREEAGKLMCREMVSIGASQEMAQIPSHAADRRISEEVRLPVTTTGLPGRRVSREHEASSSSSADHRTSAEVLLLDDSSCATDEGGQAKEPESGAPQAPGEQVLQETISGTLMQAGWRPIKSQGEVQLDGWTNRSADGKTSTAQDAVGVIGAATAVGPAFASSAEAAIPLSSMLANSGLRPKPAMWMEPPRTLSPMLTLPRTMLGNGNAAPSANAVGSTGTKAAGGPRQTTPSTAASVAIAGPGAGLSPQPGAASQAAPTVNSAAASAPPHAAAVQAKDGSTRRSPGLVGSGAGVMQGISPSSQSGTRQLLPPRQTGSQAQGATSTPRSGRAAHRSGATSARGASAGVGSAKRVTRAPVYQHLLA